MLFLSKQLYRSFSDTMVVHKDKTLPRIENIYHHDQKELVLLEG